VARLRIEFRGAETVVSLKEGETTVGRSNRCTIHLPDPGLAPVHFRIRERDRGYQLKDDGSGIGTLVNGKPVYATTLQHGDAIEAGSLHCVFLAEAEAPVRSAPPPPPTPAAPRDVKVFLWAGIAAVVVLAGVFFLLSRSSEKAAQAAWQEARRALDDSRIQLDQAVPRLLRAVEILERIDHDYPGTRIAGIASAALLDARDTLDALRRLDAEKTATGDTVDEEAAQDAFARLARIKEGAHPAVVARAERLIEDLKQARIAQHETRFAAAKQESDGFMAEKQFASALRLWSEFEVAGYSGRKRADRELEAVARKIAIEYRAVLKLAGRSPELDGRIGLLEASRDTFKGTKHGEDLEVRIGALRARRTQSKLVVVDREARPKRPATGKKPGPKEEPTDVEPAAYEDPPRVVDLVKRRRYAEAASMLHAISRHPHGKIRIEELTLLANLMADLVGAVQTRADEFTGVVLPKGAGRGDAAGATAAVLKVRQNGAESDVPWEALPAKSFVKLFRQAGFHKPSRLAVALFFDEEGLENHATQAYVNFFESEQTPVTLTRILARRRGIEEPAGGFVLFRNRLVAPAEKERVLLLERIEGLAKQARTTTNEKRRRAAWAELERIGEPALETFRLVLRDRRTRVADELGKSKAFSPSRFAARFGKELQNRRKEARAFILDPNKYPYPNKSDAAQKEAEKLVEEVRKIYARPYERLLEVSESAQLLDNELRDLDGRMARVDPLDEPIRDSIAEEIQRKLETRLIAVDNSDRKRIEHNLSVEKYNASVKTTADEEERANVKAVNEYRWMMGLHSVKIDERLVRAARKHSIEMQQRNYFAHDSPTKLLRTPGLRCKREGYSGGVSENIARGAATGAQAFWQWFKSSGHHRNMLNPGHTDLGCGAANHHWWTQNFGRATGRSLKPPNVPPDPDPPGESGNGDPAPAREPE